MGFRKMKPEPADYATYIFSQELGPKGGWSVTTRNVPEYEEKGQLCIS